MNPFYKIIDLMAANKDHESTFHEPLTIEENKQKICLKPEALNDPIKFFSWFRWVFLVASISLGVFAYYDFKSDDLIVNIFMTCFLLASIFTGFLGAFFIVPLMIKIFSKINTSLINLEDFPYLDLKKNQLVSPSLNTPIDINEISKFIYIKSNQKGWLELRLETKKNENIFLVNYPNSQQDLIDQYIQIIHKKN